MGQTIIEKILTRKTKRKVKKDEFLIIDIDFMMGHDFNAAMTIDIFKELGADKVLKPNKTCFVFDHAVPTPNENYARIQQKINKFIKEQGIIYYPQGEGICHQLLPEKGHINPGDVVIGSDSHTCTYGAFNAFATGVGSTDLAVAMMTGKLWFKVPSTIRININGKIPSYIFGKDILLYIIKHLRADGALYKTIEYGGEAVRALGMDARMTLSNMAVEMGAKAGIFEVDEKTIKWLKTKKNSNINPIYPDKNAEYEKVYNFDISNISPQIALPHTVDNVSNIQEVEGKDIQSAFIGSCSNGRIEDLRVAANILNGKKISKHLNLFVIPASKSILLEAIEEGLIEKLLKAGAIIETPSCGPCAGICGGIPEDGSNMISTATRNFKGRSGNPKANIYLASPATVALSAIEGKIVNPMNFKIN